MVEGWPQLETFCRCYRVTQNVVILTLSLSKGKNPRISLLLLLVLTLYTYPRFALAVAFLVVIPEGDLLLPLPADVTVAS